MNRLCFVVTMLLLGGCERSRPSGAAEPIPASEAPEGVVAIGDTAWVPGYATTYLDSAGVLRVDTGEPAPERSRWLNENGFEYVGFEVDTTATNELRQMGLEAEEPGREAVFGASVYLR